MGEKTPKVEMIFSEKTMLKNNVANGSLVKAGLKEETTSIVMSAAICKRKDKRWKDVILTMQTCSRVY